LGAGPICPPSVTTKSFPGSRRATARNLDQVRGPSAAARYGRRSGAAGAPGRRRSEGSRGGQRGNSGGRERTGGGPTAPGGPAGPKRRWRRWLWALVTVVVLLVAVDLAGGWYFSGQVLVPDHSVSYPVTVKAVQGEDVTLTRDSTTAVPAIMGLIWSDGSATL